MTQNPSIHDNSRFNVLTIMMSGDDDDVDDDGNKFSIIPPSFQKNLIQFLIYQQAFKPIKKRQNSTWKQANKQMMPKCQRKHYCSLSSKKKSGPDFDFGKCFLIRHT